MGPEQRREEGGGRRGAGGVWEGTHVGGGILQANTHDAVWAG